MLAIVYIYYNLIIIYFLDVNKVDYISHDQRIDSGCSNEMPDFLFEMETHAVILEVDEDQHSRECSPEIRMKNIGQQLGGLPVWFIRYNPDKYKNKGGHKRVEGESRNKRHLKLMEWINYCKKEPPSTNGDFVRAVYLYYDGWNGVGRQESIQKLER